MVTKRVRDLELVGGDPALDFANTAEGPREGEPTLDHVGDYGDLVGWAAYAGVLEPPTVERLAARASERPDEAARVLARARRLRAAVRAVFRAVAEGDEPGPGPLAQLSAFHAEALGRARLAPNDEGFEHVWDRDDLERVLWPLAVAAVDLLRAGPLDRVKVCHVCSWLFVDASRNRSRRWCSMNECGGRLKMRRYRARRATAG